MVNAIGHKRIYAAALSTETNTFSPIPTGLDDYEVIRPVDREHVSDDIVFDLWQQKAQERGDTFLFGLGAYAQPAGLTTRAVYESLRDELLDGLIKQGDVDVILLYLHGAMAAEGYEDCEGDLLFRVRQIVGPNTIIAAELDLHCHLTPAMVENANLLVAFKEYPHIDVLARADEVFDLALAASCEQANPVMAVFDCRMMGMYPTHTPEMRAVIDRMNALEQQDNVLSVSFVHGFPFGDVPDAGGKVLVITDNNLQLAEQLSEDLGREIFQHRHEITFKSLSLENALSTALEKIPQRDDPTKPVLVADQSDNAGGGAPGDSTFALRWLLDHQVDKAACAILYDPQVVKLAIAAGIGSQLLVRLGGKLCVASGDPLDIDVTVTAIEPNYVHLFPQESGDTTWFALGDTVALHCQGIDIVVSSLRCQCYSASVFADLGIPIAERQLIVVKSTQHFYADFAPRCSEVIYMAGPGAVSPNVQLINYHNVPKNSKFPWVDDPFSNQDRLSHKAI